MDNTHYHPLVKLTPHTLKSRLPPACRAQLQRRDLDTLERLLRWLDLVQRERRVCAATLQEHKRELAALCQRLDARGGET